MTNEKFREFLKSKSNSELSAWAGCSVATASRWKSGKSNPDFTVFGKWLQEQSTQPVDQSHVVTVQEAQKQEVQQEAPSFNGDVHDSNCDCDLCQSLANREVVKRINQAPSPVLSGTPPTKLCPIAPPGSVSVQDTQFIQVKPLIVEQNPVHQPITIPQVQTFPQIASGWRSKKIALMLPWYKTSNPVTAAMCMAIVKQNPQTKIYLELGDAIIQNARGKCVDYFMQEDCEWSIWIDDDIVAPFGSHLFGKWTRTDKYWNPELMQYHFLDKLFEANKQIIGGTYFGRHIGSYPQFDPSNQTAAQHARMGVDGVFEVAWVATGCLLVHRSVYESIQKSCQELAPIAERPWWDYFAKPSGRGGEDVGFAIHAKKAGIASHVHTGVQCVHIGYNAWNFKNV